MSTVLIADDEANLRKVLCALLERDGHETMAVADGEQALQVIKGGGIDILITDLKMPKMTGLELLSEVNAIEPGLPVIVITAHGTVDTAVTALKTGAFDYITKPFDKDELRLAVRKASSVGKESRREPPLTHEGTGRFGMIGQASPMQEVYSIIEKVAATPSTVLITGESGTGKELVATALHQNSKRREQPLIKVNCAAIPKDLMESEFFGYEKGAFTGAVSSKPGRFELADTGTLFLDEIAEIPNEMQVKLLRALQENELERVGGIRTIRVDVRVVAATNRNLAEEIAAGRFREDLYYRLNVVPIRLPPLRDRTDDIPLLVKAFVTKYNERLQKNITGLSETAIAALRSYAWPGNIRELENVIERTSLFAESDVVELADLPEPLRSPITGGHLGRSLDTTNASMKEIVRQATEELERDLIVKALETTGGNVTRAAHLLRISRKGLQNKMKEFDLRNGERT
ncbi:MAG: Fis family transcriptional regulator [Deltaproteobacteria bacterium RIFOXYA12_FULL_58_15]|nr:MAG: Fis family transcriptional regulator [Deltaproteobacteria bacterium RIFOXYA12_FULL_58_15]OGR10880.1 MAG: Fis family transcriptional regulator [Deltaproteobacteria bacterium RIFOXYB12_FULL_58_9]